MKGLFREEDRSESDYFHAVLVVTSRSDNNLARGAYFVVVLDTLLE